MTAPDGLPADAQEARLAEPGPSWRSSRRVTVAAAVIAATTFVLGVVWLVWAALWHATGPQVQLLGYDLDSRRVTVRFEIVKQADDAVTCVVRARDTSGAEVAREEVRLPAGPSRDVVTHTLRTTARPVSGEVEGCHVA
ncbi:MAG: DUF4307 domain-containing protein [Actinomycetes bacterium]